MADKYDDTTELLQRVAGGDADALGDVWERCYPRLERVVGFRLDPRLRGRLSICDVLQDAFIDFQERAVQYVERPDLPGYLWIRNLTLQRLATLHRFHLGAQKRDAAREISLHRGPMPQASSASLADLLVGRLTSASRAFDRAQERLALQEALNDMDPVDREILALRYFEDLSNAEVAEVLGLSRSTASTRHVRALERLRQALEKTPEFPADS